MKGVLIAIAAAAGAVSAQAADQNEQQAAVPSSIVAEENVLLAAATAGTTMDLGPMASLPTSLAVATRAPPAGTSAAPIGALLPALPSGAVEEAKSAIANAMPMAGSQTNALPMGQTAGLMGLIEKLSDPTYAAALQEEITQMLLAEAKAFVAQHENDDTSAITVAAASAHNTTGGVNLINKAASRSASSSASSASSSANQIGTMISSLAKTAIPMISSIGKMVMPLITSGISSLGGLGGLGMLLHTDNAHLHGNATVPT